MSNDSDDAPLFSLEGAGRAKPTKKSISRRTTTNKSSQIREAQTAKTLDIEPILEAFQDTQWRLSFVKRKLTNLKISDPDETPHETVQRLGCSWFEQAVLEYRDLEDVFYAIGWKRKIAKKLGRVMSPLVNTNYTDNQLFDLAFEYVLGKCDPIGNPEDRLMFPKKPVNEWFEYSFRPSAQPAIPMIQVSNKEDIPRLAMTNRLVDASNPNKVVYYHATNWRSVQYIFRKLNHMASRKCLDFGMTPSFYVTPDINVALEWCEKNREYWQDQVCILQFNMPKRLPYDVKWYKKPTKEWMEYVWDSRRCKKEMIELDYYDFVYGPMCANTTQMKRYGVSPVPHTPMKMQLCSKTDRADKVLHDNLVGYYYIEKPSVSTTTP